MDVYKERIKPLFDSTGLTVRQLSERIGIPAKHIYNWNNGIKSYDKYYEVIARYFNVSVDYLQGNTGEKGTYGMPGMITPANNPQIAEAMRILYNALEREQNEKKPVPTDGNGLNDREKLVLRLFNRLPAANQEVVIAQLQGLVQFQEAQDARSKSE